MLLNLAGVLRECLHMAASAPRKPLVSPSSVTHDGRVYPLLFEKSGWRLRSKAKTHPADFRTKTTQLRLAQTRAKEWLTKRADDPQHSRRGGGTLEALATIYLATPKRTQDRVAKTNISRLRAICKKILGDDSKDLQHVTCKEIGPQFWERYQRIAHAAAELPFSLVTRYRENIGINAAVRAARCLFLPSLLGTYRAAGLQVNANAGTAVMLPTPYVAPVAVDDKALVTAWLALQEPSPALWLAVGLARFAGLRREEIAHCRVGWLEESNGALMLKLCDRPEERFWTKTGRPYCAHILGGRLVQYLQTLRTIKPPDAYVVGAGDDPEDRRRWFDREPRKFLRKLGITAGKPLHRLRGLYADHIAKETAELIAQKQAGLKAAQEALGHTTSRTTETHYLDAIR